MFHGLHLEYKEAQVNPSIQLNDSGSCSDATPYCCMGLSLPPIVVFDAKSKKEVVFVLFKDSKDQVLAGQLIQIDGTSSPSY